MTISAEALSTIVDGLPTTDLIGWWYAGDAVTSNVTLADSSVVQAVTSVPGREPFASLPGDTANGTEVGTGELRPFLLPDGAVGPQFVDQQSVSGGYVGHVGTRFPLGSVVTRGKTFFFAVTATSTESRPSNTSAAALESQIGTIWYGDTSGTSNRCRLTLWGGTQVFCDSFGTFGNNQNGAQTALSKHLAAWPNYQVFAIRVASDGTYTWWLDGVQQGTLTLPGSPDEIKDVAAANRSVWFGRSATSNTFPTNLAWMHAVCYNRGCSDAEMLSISNLLLTELKRPVGGTQIIAVGDSITRGFRAPAGLTWATFAANGLTAQVFTLGRSSRVISGAELSGGGILDDSGTTANASNADTAVAKILADYPASARVLGLFIGTNDGVRDGASGSAATTVAALEAWIDSVLSAATAAGTPFNSVVAVLIPNYVGVTSPQATRHDEINALLRASTRINAVAETSTISIENNPFTVADDLHPGRAVHQQIGELFATAVQSTLVQSERESRNRSRER